MIYPIEKLLPIVGTFSSTFEATADTCNKLTDVDDTCDACYFKLDNDCGATFENPNWQVSLDQLKLTNPEFFI